MKLGLVFLVVFALSESIEYSSVLYGFLEGSKLVDHKSISRCKEKFSRKKFSVSFNNMISDTISLSNKCGWTSASKPLQKFQSSTDLMDASTQDITVFLLTIVENAKSNYYSDGISIGTFLRYRIASVSPYVLKFKPGKTEIKAVKSSGYPLAVFHGLGDCCCNEGMKQFTEYLGQQANVTSVCVEIGDGPSASWLLGFQKQVEAACTNLKKIPEFANGINVLGLSQGGLIARSMAEVCSIPVHNVITLGGPHMGVMSIPDCESGLICEIFNDALDLGVYDPFVQNNFGPTGYYKDQYQYDVYLKNSGYLAAANNERSINVDYANGFKSINQLVLVEFTEDTVVDPKESEQFGYYDNNSKVLLRYNETQDYINDVLGLKTLDQQGKIVFEYIVGNHLQFNDTDIQRTIIPYLI
jgi:palmitoyl-protein thioesterase